MSLRLRHLVVPVAALAVVAAFGVGRAQQAPAPTEQQRAADALAGREPPSMGGIGLTVDSVKKELDAALAGAKLDPTAINTATLDAADAAIAPYPEYAFFRYVRNAVAAARLAKANDDRALALQAHAIAVGITEALRIDYLLLNEARRTGSEPPVPTWGAPDGLRAGTPNPPAELSAQ